MNLRITLFLAMALAGILTIALIVTADESYAGINGLRAIRAFVGQKAFTSSSKQPIESVCAGSCPTR